MSTEEHYKKLLQKYLEGHCTAAEAAELYTWLQSQESRRPLLNAMRSEFERVLSEHPEIPAEISDRMETRLLQQITRKYITMRRRWSVAAAIATLLIAGGAFFYIQSHKTQAPIAKAKPIVIPSVAPGTNKAVLTLANGDQVTLDSAGNQVITQGKTTVHQQNGQLQYAVNGHEDAVVYNTLTVPRGGQFNIVLPDGSHVWLNAASSLRYPIAFSGDSRTVEIQGQGYFEVSKNEKKPFIVKANNIEVKVLGTGFDVMAYADEQHIDATLVEGAISVKHGENEERLRPGQQASIDALTGSMTVRAVDVDQVIAWKTGFFEFDNARLSDIMRQISRWYDIDIHFNQPENDRRFGGRISRSLPLADILHMLEANGPGFIMSGKELIVTSVK
jgi:transmembrane sensor